MSLKILLMEDDPMIRRDIVALFANQFGIEIFDEGFSGKDFFSKIQQCEPDLILMDAGIPLVNGPASIKEIKKKFPTLKVIILSIECHAIYLTNMIDAGADGCILKNSGVEELLFAINKILAGSMYIGHEFALNLLGRSKAASGISTKQGVSNVRLSEREQDVLELIAEGFTNAEIAKKLFTSRRTIETRRKQLLNKTSTTNTATLIRFAVVNGLIS